LTLKGKLLYNNAILNSKDDDGEKYLIKDHLGRKCRD